jgi:uncharacterized protein involved in outer membrane biogenesis
MAVKKLGLGLVALLVILVAAVLVGPSFVDWNAQKDRITAEARKLTGRELTIDGDINLALLPAPALSADGVRLANIEGGSGPAMAALESLEVRIALMPLLQGEVQVESVSLVKPVILLEVLADGRKNWELAAGDGDASTGDGGQPAEGASGAGGEVRLDSLAISDGTLIYRDARAGREERVENLNAELAAESLKGPFAAAGDAVVRGLKTEFQVGIGRLLDGGATSLNLTLGLTGATKIQFGGAMSLHPDSTSLRGRLKAEGETLAAVIRAVTGVDSLPTLLAKPFTLSTEITAEPARVSAAELNLGLGEVSIGGDARIALGPPFDAKISLSASRIDLDKLLAESGDDAAAAEPETEAAGEETPAKAGDAAPGGVALPIDATGSLKIAVDALVYRGQVVRQVLLSAALAGGRVKIGQALALFPGGSDVSLTGTLDTAATVEKPGPRFAGRLDAASDNLRAVFDWMGVDVATVPAERLRRMSLSARIDAVPGQLTLGDIDLRFDLSRATGGIAVALRERPGLGIGLAVDRINFDAYLSAPAPGAAKAGGAAAEGTPAEDTVGGGAAGALGVLESFDANLDLKLGRLDLRGVTASDLRLDATLSQGTLVLREARVGDVAGSSARVTGTVAGLTAAQTLDGDIDLKVADPVRLAKLAKIESDVLARIGPFGLKADVKGSLDSLTFDARLDALGGEFGAAGSARPAATPPAFDVTLRADHPNMARLTGALAPEIALGPGLGGVKLGLRVAGIPQKVKVSELSGDLGPARLDGGFSADLSGPKPAFDDIDLAVAAKHPDLSRMLGSLGPKFKLGAGLGGVDIKGRVAGSSSRLTVSELDGTLGPVSLQGSLGANLSGAAPVLGDLDLRVAVKHPDLARLGRGIGQDLPALGAIDLKAQVTGDPKRIEVAGLGGTLGQTALSGSLAVDLSGPKPALDIDLSTGALPLGALMAPGAKGKAGAKQETGTKKDPAKTLGTGGAQAAQAPPGERWSREPSTSRRCARSTPR